MAESPAIVRKTSGTKWFRVSRNIVLAWAEESLMGLDWSLVWIRTNPDWLIVFDFTKKNRVCVKTKPS
jgi:hypothetical protein